MDYTFYNNLAKDSIEGKTPDYKTCERILSDQDIELLPLLQAAYEVRKKFFGNEVTVHIINNVQNGHCFEDCNYCAQSKNSMASINKYTIKSDDEILEEAKLAHEKGAFRYCMVISGYTPPEKTVTRFVNIVKKIKSLYPMEVCLSPGVLSEEDLLKLKEAGLDRLNHNLNTSKKFYNKICTTHSYEDRLNTLQKASKIGLSCCSGVILGMGESTEDIICLARELRNLKNVKSIPVNFLIPIEGNVLKEQKSLNPVYCLKILSLFRFLNPESEIRAAAGREIHLRNMETLCLYPANSIFMEGYLNTKGENRIKDLNMIKDAGFTIKSDWELDELLANEIKGPGSASLENQCMDIKKINDLRPALKKPSLKKNNAN